ncbi:uncharacterized protein LOC143348392 [Colletes latitarsis]|uniref:uncharacterized protein LOC143348392 n=1 Tax=Colletes latitarsis TaxID=2605962 RepID=UPI004035884B
MRLQKYGESDLHECEINEACNVIHNRFWVSSLTERLCRCSNGKECLCFKRICNTHDTDVHRCTSPENYLCIYKNRSMENVQELLYSGPAYKAYYLPFKKL